MSRLWLVFVVISIVMSLFRALRKAKSGPTFRQRGWSPPTAPGTRKQQVQSPYEVLEVRPGSSEQEITSAYYRLVQMYHPDKVAEMAPEFKRVAEQRMKEINAAYEELKRRGWR